MPGFCGRATCETQSGLNVEPSYVRAAPEPFFPRAAPLAPRGVSGHAQSQPGLLPGTLRQDGGRVSCSLTSFSCRLATQPRALAGVAQIGPESLSASCRTKAQVLGAACKALLTYRLCESGTLAAGCPALLDYSSHIPPCACVPHVLWPRPSCGTCPSLPPCSPGGLLLLILDHTSRAIWLSPSLWTPPL